MNTLRFMLAMLVSAYTALFAAPVWQAKGDTELYLFGTVHVLSADEYPLANVITETFNQCDRLWLEIDSQELNDPTVMSEVQKTMLLPAGETLFDHLSEESVQRMQQLAKESGLSLTLFQSFKPWAAVNALTVTIMQMKGYDAEYGLDTYFENLARERGIPINALETAVWQMGMLNDLGEQYTDAFVEFSTNNMDDIDQMTRDMMRYWRTGDVAALYDQADFTDYPEIEQRILTRRNWHWVSQLAESKTDGIDCVAVGALHMGGPNSVLKLLERRGYSITQLVQ